MQGLRSNGTEWFESVNVSRGRSTSPVVYEVLLASSHGGVLGHPTSTSFYPSSFSCSAKLWADTRTTVASALCEHDREISDLTIFTLAAE